MKCGESRSVFSRAMSGAFLWTILLTAFGAVVPAQIPAPSQALGGRAASPIQVGVAGPTAPDPKEVEAEALKAKQLSGGLDEKALEAVKERVLQKEDPAAEATPPDLDEALRSESVGPQPAAYLLFENFDSYGTGAVNFPQGGWNWVATSGTYTPMWTIQSSLTNPTATAPSAPSAARFYSFIVPAGQSGRLYRTTGVDLTGFGGVNVDLNFYMYHYTGSPTLEDTIQVTISTDGGLNWSLIGPVIHRLDGSTGWKLHAQSLNAYTGAGFSDVRIGFHGVSQYGYNIFIDNVGIYYPGPQLSYTSSAITAETCILGGSGQNNGIIDPGETVTMNVTLNNSLGDQAATGISTTLSCSTPGIFVSTATSAYPDLAVAASGTNTTPFVFKVAQSMACGTTLNFNLHATATGGFVYDIPFTKLLGSSTTVLSENFSGATVPNPPAGWTFAAVTQANPWTTYSPVCTTNGMRCLYNASAASDAWAYTPALSLTAGTIYTLAFNQKAGLASYTESLEVKCGTATSPASQTIAIWSGTGLVNTTCTQRTGTFTVPTTGTYYIGFHANSAANMYYIAADDVLLTAPVCNPCPDPCAGTTITLSPASPLPPGQPGVPYSQAITASGGTAPYSYLVTSGTLPPGLNLDTNTGLLSGTPTTPGVYNFTVTATDASTCQGFVSYTMEICGTIALAPSALPDGYAGVAYSQTLAASGGTAPYTYAVTSGALPDGLTLTSAGVLSGSPTTLGTFNFNVTATDAYGCTGVQGYTVRICPLLTLSPAALPDGEVGKPYNQAVTAGGGTAPYTYAVTAGSLPAGLSLDSGTGVLSGTPTASGTFNLTVTAAEAGGCAVSQVYALSVYPSHCGDVSISVPALGSNTPDWPSTHGTQSMRMYRDGAPSGCGGKACPGTSGGAGARTDDIFRFTNAGCSDACVTVTLTVGATCATNLMAAAYLNSFDPSNICTNFIGDAAYSFAATGSGSFGFVIPQGATGVLVINALDAGGTCFGGYSLLVSGLPCSGPVLTASASISGDSCYLGGHGGGDGYADAGESATLSILAQNGGQRAATNVQGTLTTSSPLVTITQGTGSWPDIQPCAGAPNLAPDFGFLMSGSAPCGTLIPFSIHFTSSEGTWDRTFSIQVTPGSQISLVSENFNDWFPAGWSIVNNGGTCDWNSSSAVGRANGTGGTGDCADADSDLCGSGSTMDTRLVSPIFSLNFAGYSSAHLQFKTIFYSYYCTTSATGDVDVTTDGGSTWTNLLHLTGLAGASNQDLDLTPYLGNSSVQVGFHYVSPCWDFLWEVDDVQVTALDFALCSAHTCCPTITVTNPAVATGAAGVPFSAQFTQAGGVLPIAFSTVSALPAGLTLAADGTLSGTPTVLGTYPITVTATDANGCQGAGGTYTLVISCPTITVSPAALPDGAAGVAYSQSVAASPAGGSYTYILTAGSLPPGFALDSSTGAITGTTATVGTYSFTVTAAGWISCTGSQDCTLTIVCPTVTVSPATLPGGLAGTAYSQTVSASPAGTTYTYAVSAGSLPPGLALDGATGAITGTPTTAGSYSFTIAASGWGTCTGSQAYTVVIACPTITVSPATLPGVTAGTAYSPTVSAGPSGTSYTFSVSAGTLPPGLALDGATGAITGTPTTAGSYSFTIAASGWGTCAGSQAYTVVIACPTVTVSPATLPGGTAGTAYSQTVSAGPSGTSYTFSVSAGTLPPGLALDGATGAITGTPTTAGSYSFTVTATGWGTCAGSQAYTVAMACPTVTVGPATLPGGTAGTTYSQSVTALPSGTYSYSVTAGSLPPGLTLAGATGAITGIPTTAGTYSFTVTAMGWGTCAGSQAFTVVMACPTITVSPVTLPGGTAGTAYSQSVTASPSGTYSYAVTAGALPPGLSLDTVTGAITGIPTTSGTYSFTVTATGWGTCTGSQAYTVAVACPTITLNPATLPGGTAGTAYSQSVTAAPAGTTYTYALSAGSLPPGLSFDTTTGAITGTPTTHGTYNFTITAMGWGTCTGSQGYSLTIACPAITVTPTTLPGATAGLAYSQSVTAAPAGTTYTYAVSAGSLPPGLSFDTTTGAITGTPTTAGTYSFTVDAAGWGTCTGSQPYTLTVACPTVTVSPATLPGGTAGAAYSQSVTASPAGTTYSYAVTAGTLPPGLILSAATGAVTGTPTTNGTYAFTIAATGWGSCTGSQAYTVVISCPAVTITPATLPGGTAGTAYSQSLAAAPAGTTYTYAVSAGSLPPGIALAPAGTLSGTPTTAGTYSFTVTSTGWGSCTGSQTYSVTIACPAITLAALPNGTAGAVYTGSAAASPAGTYTYAVTAGALPPGLTLNTYTGAVTGTPTTNGTYAFTVTATGWGTCTGSQAYSLTIACPTISLAPAPTLPSATVGTVPYSQTFLAAPAGTVYTYAVTAGVLPPGLTFNGTTGALTGTVTAAGTYSFTVTATGWGSCTGSQAYTLTALCPVLVVSPASLPAGLVGIAYSAAFSASGGTAPFAFAVTSGALPAGLTLAADGTLSGTPAAGGTFAFTVTATDAYGCQGSTSYTVVISSFDLSFYDDSGRSRVCVNSLTGDFQWTVLQGIGAGTYKGKGTPSWVNGVLTVTAPAGLPYSFTLKYLKLYHKATGSYANRPSRVASQLVDNNTLDDPPGC